MSLIILVGPKGAGKTTIGKFLESQKERTIFLEVEKLFMEIISDGLGDIIRRGLLRVEQEVEASLSTHDVVIMESTAAGTDFNGLVEGYKAKFGRVIVVKVSTPLDECLTRCLSRDQTNQIPVSEERIRAYNVESDNVQFAWDAVIDNNSGSFDGPAILSAFERFF